MAERDALSCTQAISSQNCLEPRANVSLVRNNMVGVLGTSSKLNSQKPDGSDKAKIDRAELLRSIINSKSEKRVLELDDETTIWRDKTNQIRIGDKVFSGSSFLKEFFENVNPRTSNTNGYGCLRLVEAGKSYSDFWSINRKCYFDYLLTRLNERLIISKHIEENIEQNTSGKLTRFPYSRILQVHGLPDKPIFGVECGGAVVVNALMYTGLVMPTLDRQQFEAIHTYLWQDQNGNLTNEAKANGASTKEQLSGVLKSPNNLLTGEILLEKTTKANSTNNFYFRGKGGYETFKLEQLQEMINTFQKSDWAKISGMDTKKITVKFINLDDGKNFLKAKAISDKGFYMAYESVRGDVYPGADHWIGIHQIDLLTNNMGPQQRIDAIKKAISGADLYYGMKHANDIINEKNMSLLNIYNISYVDNIGEIKLDNRKYTDYGFVTNQGSSRFAWYVEVV